MSVQSFLERMRSKPEHVRKQYAFWSSLGITAIIFAFWLGSFTLAGKSTSAAVAQSVQNAGSPGQTLVASVGSFFVDIKDLIFGPKKMVYSSVEVLPGKK